MKIRTAQSQVTFDQPIQEVYRFFCRPENLNETTPNFLHFTITSPQPIIMQEAAHIDYTIRLFGIPLKWRTLIKSWNPPATFNDKQILGPFRLWEHEHVFEEKNGKTTMTDNLKFAVPGWFLEPIIYHLFVKNWVKQILSYREKKALEIFSKKI